MSDFKVIDKRRRVEHEVKTKKQFSKSLKLQSIPASLEDTEDYKEIRVSPDKCFVHPAPGRIVCQEDHALGKVGRIIVPDSVKKRPTTGTILEVGRGVEGYQVGDRIAYGLYSGTVLTFKGWDPKTKINFRVLGVDEILVTVDKKTPELEGIGV